MTTYGNKYIFNFISQNGDEVEVCIQKKNYSGSFVRRPVGRGPVLKRERNGAILGTSLELYAECRIDQEYVELYTSSADEFRVLVYKNRELQWTGFVSPELYAEPDIAPPYDVQIIATDGLGELKNTLFDRPDKSYPLGDHIDYILRKTGLSLSVDLISSLSWDDEAHNNSPSSLLSLTANLTHLASNSDYDVLQDILTSFNACITQQTGRWMIVRKTDIYNNIPLFRTAAFGSVNKTTWWPIGSLSADIVPAKRKLTLTHENNYKDSILPGLISGVSGGWEFATGVYYNDSEKAYILSDGDYITYTMEFPVYPISVPLKLSINARPLFNSSEKDRAVLGYFVELDGTVNGVRGTYYLVHSYDDALGKAVWQWYPEQIPLMHTWWREALPEDVEQEVTTVNAVLPLGDNVRPDRIRLIVQNYPVISGYAIAVYDIALAQNDQIRGLKLIAEVGNNARESVETSVVISSSADPMLAETMYGVLRLDGGITSWHTPYNAASDLLKFLAADYAMLTALPAIRYRGTLNVPTQVTPWIPFIFERDNTYYVLETYSYDLLLDELEVELVSIPNSRVSIESETIIEIPAGSLSGSGTVSGGGGSSSGGGSGEGDNEGGTLIVDSEMDDESENAVQNRVIKAYVDSETKKAQAAAEQYIQEEVLTDYATTEYVEEREVYLVGYTEDWVTDLENDIKANPQNYIGLKTINNQSLFGSGNLEVKTTVDANDIRNAVFTGTGSQFLKGDGSLDSNAYLPITGGTIESAGIPLTIKRTNNLFSVISFYGIVDGTSQHFGYLGFSGVGEPIYMTSRGSERILIHSGNIVNYALPYSGGKLSNSATTLLVVDSTSEREAGIRFTFSDVSKGWVGYNTNNGVHLYSYGTGNNTLGIKDDGTPHYSGKTLIHSGNVGNYAIAQGGNLTQSLKIYERLTDLWTIGGNSPYRLTISRSGGWASPLIEVFNNYNVDSPDSIVVAAAGGNGTINRIEFVQGADSVDNTILRISKDNLQHRGHIILHDGNAYEYAIAVNTSINPATSYNVAGYGYASLGWPLTGAAMIIGANANYRMALQGYAINGSSPKLLYNYCYNGVWQNWRDIAFIDSDIIGNAATATDADMLDGKHLTDIMNIGFDNTLDLDTLYSEGALIARYWVFANSSNISNQPWSNSAAQVWTLPGSYNLQIAKFYNSNDIRLRGRGGEGWTNWQRLAFTDSTVEAANCLATPRTIWGQSFDGTEDVSGNINLGKNAIGLSLTDTWTDDNDNTHPWYGLDYRHFANGATLSSYFGLTFKVGAGQMLINSSGNVGIGTTAPQYKLDVAGTGRFTDLASFDEGVKIGSTTLSNDNLGLSINTSFYPSSAGLSLGHSSYRWDNVYANDVYTDKVKIGDATLTWDGAALTVDKPFYSTSQVSSGAKAVEAKAVIAPLALPKFPTASTTTEYTDEQIASQYGLTTEVLDNLARGIYTRVTITYIGTPYVWDYEMYFPYGGNKTLVLRNNLDSSFKFERNATTGKWKITNA